MSSKPTLRLDWCSHEAAKYAVEHWHYSKTMPVGRIVKVGAWEDQRFIGCVLFAQGNNQFQGAKFGLKVQEVCELVRVALTEHKSAVSRVVSLAMRFLKRLCPGIRLVVSYADPEQGHVGGIYQAGNWTYVGTGGSTEAFFDDTGRRIHSRSVSPTGIKTQFGQRRQNASVGAVRRVEVMPKHKYLFALDDEMRRQIAPLAKPYPKRPRAGSIAVDAPAVHAGEGGSIPTSALHRSAAD